MRGMEIVRATIPVAALSLAALGAPGGVKAQAQAADLSGTYQCKPDPLPCAWPGASPSISQSGNRLEIKGDKGETANAMLTSDITISAGGTFNSYGIVRPDKTIDWSDGTKWLKQ